MSSISDFLAAQDINGLATFCENSELSAPLGTATPDIYGTLLAVYLLQNELDHAKLLWKRIPGAVKSSNPEVTALWEIGKQLWKHEYEGVYPLILQHDWPPHIAPLLQQLKDLIQQRAISLIGRAYSNISFTEVSKLLGTDNDTTLSILKAKCWKVEGETVYPKPDPLGVSQRAESSQDKLAQLVDIVSFLEN